MFPHPCLQMEWLSHTDQFPPDHYRFMLHCYFLQILHKYLCKRKYQCCIHSMIKILTPVPQAFNKLSILWIKITKSFTKMWSKIIRVSIIIGIVRDEGSGTITITSVNKGQDDGSYYCTASNSDGSANSTTAILRVLGESCIACV